MNQSDFEIVQRKLKTSVMIWGGFIVSILIYAGAVEWMERSGNGTHLATQNNLLHLVFLSAAVFCFIAAGIAKHFMLRVPAQKPEWEVEILANRLINASLVSLALSEAICLLGFAEYFILRNYDSFYLFFIVAMLGIIMHMPRYSQWKSYLELMSGIPLPEELQ